LNCRANSSFSFMGKGLYALGNAHYVPQPNPPQGRPKAGSPPWGAATHAKRGSVGETSYLFSLAKALAIAEFWPSPSSRRLPCWRSPRAGPW